MKKYLMVNIASMKKDLVFEVFVKESNTNSPNTILSLILLKRLVSEIPEDIKDKVSVLVGDSTIFKEDHLKLFFPLTNVTREYFIIDEPEKILEFENDSDALLFFELNK